LVGLRIYQHPLILCIDEFEKFPDLIMKIINESIYLHETESVIVEKDFYNEVLGCAPAIILTIFFIR